MASDKEHSRRDFISYMPMAMGVIALGSAGWVAIDALNPAADTKARAVEVDLQSIRPGERMMIVWYGKPVFIFRRTPEELKQVRAEDWRDFIDPESDESRVKKGHDEWLVVVGLCTMHGCILYGNKTGQSKGRYGGWFCACCGAHYDMSGRARSYPAPRNMRTLDYTFITGSSIRLKNPGQ